MSEFTGKSILLPGAQFNRMNLRMSVIVIMALLVLIPFSVSNNTYVAQGTDAESGKAPISCSCVAFRLDDIQDYFVTKAQMAVITAFEQNNASLTAGIIGNHFGNDSAITGFLQDKLVRDYDNGFSIEIANHGWNHEDFSRFTKEEQSAFLQRTDEKIMDVLGPKPVVFIPPYNKVNDDTIEALLENDFIFMSANTANYPASFISPYQNGSDGIRSIATTSDPSRLILHFPSSADTGDMNSGDTEWLSKSHDETFSAISASMDELGYAVVTMHPMEFASRSGTIYQNEVDDSQIRELMLLINDIRDAGFKIVTISQIDKDYAAIPEFSRYSIHIVLAVSVTMMLWLSSKNNNQDLRNNSKP